jgi:zinc/manganese transport system substrate-binding protein
MNLSKSRFARAAAIPAFLFGLLMISPAPARAASKIRVVTSITDLAALTEEVGGDRVEVDSIARGYQDPHFVEAKPSFLLKLRRADLLVVVGLQLEISWLPPLINRCGNAKVQVNAPGYLDASQFAEILEIPTTQVTRAMGDVHPFGNPHYWLDPENGRRIAQGILAKLKQVAPQDAAYFDQRYQAFDQHLTQKEKEWDERMKPFHGRKIVTYHRSWPNFTKRFGLEVIDYVEPRPGIPPSPGHTVELIQTMRREGIKVILVEPYFDLKTPNAVARETGAKVVVMLPSVGGEKEVTDYFKLFDYDIDLLTRAFQSNP